MTTTASRRQIDVSTIADQAPFGIGRWSVIVLCFVIALLDGFDTQSIAFIGSSIKADFGLSTAMMTWVITASTVGMCLGAVTLGSLGDRIGRRPTIMLALTIFGVGSILGSLAQNPEQIIALRLLIGVGMGGATPSILALTAEYSSRERRGTFMTLVLLGLPGGALLGGLVAAAWLPAVGWRGIFLIGGILPLLLVAVCTFALPESPALLTARGTQAAQARARALMRRYFDFHADEQTNFVTTDVKLAGGSVAELFSPRFRAVTIAVFSVYFLNWIAWFLLLLWMPTALTSLGLSASSAAMGTVTVNGAFILFALPLSVLLPRINARNLLLVMFGSGVLIALGLGLAGSNFTVVFILIGLAGFGIGGQQLALNYLIANAYPTQLRSTATGWGIGIGRLGTIIGSALGGVLLSSLGVAGYFMVLAIPLALAGVTTVLVKKEYGAPMGEWRGRGGFPLAAEDAEVAIAELIDEHRPAAD